MLAPRTEAFKPVPALLSTLAAAGSLHCVYVPGILPRWVAGLAVVISAVAVARFVLTPLLRRLFRRRRTDIPL